MLCFACRILSQRKVKVEQKIAKWSHLGMRIKAGLVGCRVESRAFMEVFGNWFQDKKNNIEAMVIVQVQEMKIY